MPYEDPIEAALRALTGVEWTKRKNVFEARTNHTQMEDLQEILNEHHIPSHGEVSAARSGRYIITVAGTETVNIQKAVTATKAKIKPHRRKWHS